MRTARVERSGSHRPAGGLIVIGLTFIGFVAIGLAVIGLGVIGLAVIGLAANGLVPIGLVVIGLVPIGLVVIGLGTIGLTAMGLIFAAVGAVVGAAIIASGENAMTASNAASDARHHNSHTAATLKSSECLPARRS